MGGSQHSLRSRYSSLCLPQCPPESLQPSQATVGTRFFMWRHSMRDTSNLVQSQGYYSPPETTLGVSGMRQAFQRASQHFLQSCRLSSLPTSTFP